MPAEYLSEKTAFMIWLCLLDDLGMFDPMNSLVQLRRWFRTAHLGDHE